MILILAPDNDDTVEDICRWLNYYGKSFIRINPTNYVKKFDIRIDACGFDFDLVFESNAKIRYSEIKSVLWRGTFLFVNQPIFCRRNLSLRAYLLDELKEVEYIIQKSIQTKTKFGNVFKYNINKIEVLAKAAEVGFLIPNSLISNVNKSISKFVKTNSKSICKGISNVYSKKVGNKLLKSYTTEVTQGDIRQKNFPSLFQNFITKTLEIRVFYFDNKFYSISIDFKGNPNKNIDYRQSYDNNLLGYSKYVLPSYVESKLKKIIKYFELNTCSIDLILNHENEFVFLEINPDGQFGFVSFYGNYYLEKLIAKKL